MSYKITRVDMDDEFKICPLCGYKDGFHIMLKQEGIITKWLFICPSCSEVFDTGHTIKKEK